MLLDLERLAWDDELLELFSIDRGLLPELHPVVGRDRRGADPRPDAADRRHRRRPAGGALRAVLLPRRAGQGDVRHRAASCSPTSARSRAAAPEGLLKTAVATAPGGAPEYALEGAILASGAAIQWLRDELGLFADAADSETLARHVDSSEGVYFVPALTGLGSPHWDPDARGLISGITRGTTRAHIARAALEAIAFQVADVVDAVPGELAMLRADGGAIGEPLPHAVPGRRARTPRRGRARAGVDRARRSSARRARSRA